MSCIFSVAIHNFMSVDFVVEGDGGDCNFCVLDVPAKCYGPLYFCCIIFFSFCFHLGTISVLVKVNFQLIIVWRV